jgi:hypothetical protein
MTDPKLWRACTRKRKYKTERNALDQLRRIAKTGKIIPHTANAYKCQHCHQWHLGHRRDK